MRGVYLVTAAMFLAASALCSASSSYVVPTTTLSAQTSNNTSAANSFSSQSNGNRGAASVSKVDVHSLLYSGATTKVYAHLLLWFGPSNHMNVGYSSTDAAQIKSQIDDMVSRGIDGVIIDWYGSNNGIDQGTKLVMAEAENHPGFTFAIMIDKGTIEWDSCAGCTPQQAFINQLQYIENTYFSSPAYMTRQGQPVITNFNIDLSYSIDWNAANAALSTHPMFLFQNNDGFNHTLSDGSYAWVMPTTTDFGKSYLASFYDTGLSFPTEQVVGATYKGFNDSLASWGSHRVMSQQCGQTWLQTFSDINGLYNSGKQLTDLQLVTWNDYEEGTEIESGIDNCLTLAPSVLGNALQWSISGDESTVDHYTVYISSDGANLMALTDLTPGLRSLNLCGFPIPNGTYKLFVQAVGKPTLANQISGAISYNSACNTTPPVPPPPPPPALAFGASPSSVTIPAGQSGRFTVTAKPQSGAFNSAISLSCAGIPSNLSCSFSPASITPGSGVATSTLTISAAAVTGMNLPQRNNSLPIYAAFLLPFGIGGFALAGSVPRRRKAQLLALIVVVGIGMAGSSCGGSAARTQAAAAVPPASSYSVTIQGNATSSQLSTVVSVTVQ
ncbi:MAG: glycoside hydrolase family 71/99 protein [Candidatus Sulfotelmatobacter sp.]